MRTLKNKPVSVVFDEVADKLATLTGDKNDEHVQWCRDSAQTYRWVEEQMDAIMAEVEAEELEIYPVTPGGKRRLH